jgi:cell division protein ZapE
MEGMFTRLSSEELIAKQEIEVLGRQIPVKKLAPGIIWFDFFAICDGPRAQTDYLEIATEFHTVFISGIPKLMAKDASIARRFTWLVDVFYDNRVKLIASAAVLSTIFIPTACRPASFSVLPAG